MLPMKKIGLLSLIAFTVSLSAWGGTTVYLVNSTALSRMKMIIACLCPNEDKAVATAYAELDPMTYAEVDVSAQRDPTVCQFAAHYSVYVLNADGANIINVKLPISNNTRYTLTANNGAWDAAPWKIEVGSGMPPTGAGKYQKLPPGDHSVLKNYEGTICKSIKAD